MPTCPSIRKLVSVTSFSILANLPGGVAAEEPQFTSRISAEAEPMQSGKFAPDWDSLKQYEVPDWFRDAKFGIWAHWGPQCQPEHGDWYARSMYEEGSGDYKFHVEH